ncbi:GNAT family N-acetyltransferase [Microtetraspora glauca]|uniref:GNAT family N-acetyltransferase n=1 Tax=Microtetraspora glauca TaxID=1996 RepID=A0ABV3GHZ8_MICGL
MTFSVRRGEPADAEEVLRVKNTSWQAAYRGLLPDAYLDALVVTPGAVAHWRAMMADPLRGVVVGEAGEEIVGLSAFGPVEDPVRDGGPDCEIYAIYALREHWSTGLGRALMTRSLDRLRELGHREVGLWAFEANARARRFYERIGFALSGRVQTMDVSGASFPEVHYRMALAADSA